MLTGQIPFPGWQTTRQATGQQTARGGQKTPEDDRWSVFFIRWSGPHLITHKLQANFQWVRVHTKAQLARRKYRDFPK